VKSWKNKKGMAKLRRFPFISSQLYDLIGIYIKNQQIFPWFHAKQKRRPERPGRLEVQEKSSALVTSREIAHQGDQGLDPVKAHGVVHTGPESPHGTVPLEARKSGGFRFFQ